MPSSKLIVIAFVKEEFMNFSVSITTIVLSTQLFFSIYKKSFGELILSAALHLNLVDPIII